MEYRDFSVPTTICRFYSFSKNLIIISSFIMSFIALDRFLNIALPHYRLVTPRRVKILLTLFISIGIGLGTLTALAFSTQPTRKNYLAYFNLNLANESNTTVHVEEISLEPNKNLSIASDITDALIEQLTLPIGVNVTNLTLEYKSTTERCFADTSIVSEDLRDLVKHLSNKVFFTLIGIVTIFYTITFVLALHRQNPRIRALKKSLNVLNKFDSYPSTRSNQLTVDSVVSIQRQSETQVTTTIANLSTRQKKILLNEINQSDDLAPKRKLMKPFSNKDEKPYEMSNLIHHDNEENQNQSSSTAARNELKHNTDAVQEHNTSISDGLSDDIVNTLPEKITNFKQVSFRIETNTNKKDTVPNQHLSASSNYFSNELDINNDMYYKLPCPCSTTRQLLIKFHFSRPTSQLSTWLCCCCVKRKSAETYRESVEIQNQDESTKTLTSNTESNRAPSTHSDTLRRQLHQHRLKQIRMASTFLIITVSFVLFYLPSILNAERIIKSPIMIYYLYLCTHALNPIIYCFMNPSLRAYVLSMFNCRNNQNDRNLRKVKISMFER